MIKSKKNITLCIIFLSLWIAQSSTTFAKISCPGQPPSTLTWSSTNPSSCTSGFTGGSASPACNFSPSAGGSKSGIAPGVTCSASITCENGSTRPSASDTLTYDSSKVWNGSACVAAGAAPTVTVTWTPSTITAGGTSAIRIRSSDPSATCTANLTGPSPWSGGIPATFDNSYTFLVAGTEVATITCTNGSGTGSGSATLTINPAGAPLVNGVCSASHYNCSSGTVSGPSENATQWTWQCLGSGGGASPVCGETKPAPGTCGGYQAWGSGCSAIFPTTSVGNNTPSTDATNADYTGWAIMKCLSPGAFGYVSGSCAYTPVPTGDPCSQYASVNWNPGCYGRLEPVGDGMFPVADGGGGWAYNTAPGYTTASLGFFSCSNGSWLPAGGTCTAITSCGPGSGATPKNPEPIGASACSSGPLNSSSPADTSLAWNWTCGSSSCSAPKYGCNALHNTNYNPSGPANTYGCASTCDSGWVWNATWARCDGAPPDLTPLAVGTIPAVPAPGVAAQHFFTVKNAGGTAVPSFPNYMKIATGPGGSGTVTYDNSLWAPALSADETRTVNNPYTFPTAGTYSLQICVDQASIAARVPGTIVESNEGNNCSGWTDVTVGTCANGANNPPTCNQCPATQYWDTTSSSCKSCGPGGLCSGPGGNPSTPIPPTLVCNNGGTPPACTPLPTASLLVGATNLSYNGQTTLTWSSTGASPSGCVAGGPWLNSPNNAGSGLTDPLTTTSTFTFQCTGPSGTSALVSRTITVCPSASPIWTGAVCRPLPSVGPLGLTGQYTPAGTLDFTCNDADRYEVWKGLRTVGTVIRASTVYPGATVHVPVTAATGAGNYNVYCSALDWTGARIWSSPSAKWYSPVTPTPPVMSITASPKTIQKGSESAITWNVKYPNSACKITASPVCSGECTTAKDGVKIENTRLLNSKLTSPSEMTDANDPNGRRKVTESFWKPINPLADDKISAGKKTFLFNSTTDFTLDCNTTVPLTTDPVKKVRVNVTSSNEG